VARNGLPISGIGHKSEDPSISLSRHPGSGEMIMLKNDMVICSVDDHAIEPPEAYFPHYPADKKDEAPRVIEKDGKDVWIWNDTIYPTIGLNAVVGRPRSEYGMEP